MCSLLLTLALENVVVVLPSRSAEEDFLNEVRAAIAHSGDLLGLGRANARPASLVLEETVYEDTFYEDTDYEDTF